MKGIEISEMAKHHLAELTGLEPVTVMLKSAAALVPPLSLMTCLITMTWGWTSSFVIVHVLTSPTAIGPAQSALKVAA
jgi:hypothetical protein